METGKSGRKCTNCFEIERTDKNAIDRGLCHPVWFVSVFHKDLRGNWQNDLKETVHYWQVLFSDSGQSSSLHCSLNQNRSMSTIKLFNHLSCCRCQYSLQSHCSWDWLRRRSVFVAVQENYVCERNWCFGWTEPVFSGTKRLQLAQNEAVRGDCPSLCFFTREIWLNSEQKKKTVLIVCVPVFFVGVNGYFCTVPVPLRFGQVATVLFRVSSPRAWAQAGLWFSFPSCVEMNKRRVSNVKLTHTQLLWKDWEKAFRAKRVLELK